MTNSMVIFNNLKKPLKLKKVIDIDGMDGGGKETQSTITRDRLADMGEEYTLVPFPQYESYSGSLVREYLRNNKTVNKTLEEIKTDSLLYTFNRFQYFMDNGFTLAQCKNYIFDRYTTANMLYQTLDMSIEDKRAYVEWISNLEYEMLRIPKPDIVIILRCSEKLSIENIRKRGKETDFFESMDMQRKVRENIDFFVKEYGWVAIDVDRNGVMRDRMEINDEIMSLIIS